MRRSEEKVVFLWMRWNDSVYARLGGNVMRETCLYLSNPPPLVCLTKQTIHFYDFFHMKFSLSTPLPRPIFLSNSSYTLLPSDSLIVCGGSSHQCTLYPDHILKIAFLVHFTGEIEDLPDMKYPRNNSGIIFWQDKIHIFGSFHGKKRTTSEYFDGNNWKITGNMHYPRSFFTPVAWKTLFLCGGETTGTIESFDGLNFDLLPLLLPEKCSTLTCFNGKNALIVLTTSHISTISKQTSTDKYKIEVIPRKKGSFCAVFTLPVYRNEVVFNVEGDLVARYELIDGNRVE